MPSRHSPQVSGKLGQAHYNDDDQLTQLGTHTYTYDDNGNQITRGTRSFTYDLENRLLSSVQNNTRTYTYDGDGNRLTDTIGTAVNDRVLLWDTNFALPQLTIERDGNGTFQRSYTYGSGLLAESTSSANAYYYLTDSIGSIANLVRYNGDVKWTYTYEPFGTLRSETSGSSAPLNLMRFTGERIDTNGNFYNLRARMLDPATGRFLQEDPIVGPPSMPRVGAYVYVRDRPTVAVDPSGLWCLIPNLSSDSGCLGGGAVESAMNWVDENTWEISSVITALACISTSGAGCAVVAGTYVASQTAVLYDQYGGFSWHFLLNATCGAAKTAGSIWIKMPPQVAVGLALDPTIGTWWSGPGCISVSSK